jgi:hypothetical protein
LHIAAKQCCRFGEYRSDAVWFCPRSSLHRSGFYMLMARLSYA